MWEEKNEQYSGTSRRNMILIILSVIPNDQFHFEKVGVPLYISNAYALFVANSVEIK